MSAPQSLEEIVRVIADYMNAKTFSNAIHMNNMEYKNILVTFENVFGIKKLKFAVGNVFGRCDGKNIEIEIKHSDAKKTMAFKYRSYNMFVDYLSGRSINYASGSPFVDEKLTNDPELQKAYEDNQEFLVAFKEKFGLSGQN